MIGTRLAQYEITIHLGTAAWKKSQWISWTEGECDLNLVLLLQ